MKRKLVLVSASLLIIAAGGMYLYQTAAPEPIAQPKVTSTQVSSPKVFVENISHPLLTLEQPLQNSTITSPLTISGKARGSWFFEATFPVILTNWDGLIIAEGIATAQGDWMTKEFVPFTAELTFTPDTTVSNRGSLILQKANASGLPEQDDAYEITVFFE